MTNPREVTSYAEDRNVRLPRNYHPWFKPELFMMDARSKAEAIQIALYLTFLEETGRPATARRCVPVTNYMVDAWREKIDHFTDLEGEALEGFKAKLHDEAIKRAVDGWDEPVFYKGEVAGYIQRKSDRILELMMKGHMPETFGDKLAVDQRISAGVLAIPASMTMDEWLAANTPKAIEPPGSLTIDGDSQVVDADVVNAARSDE